jgi:hypothetical protein
LFGVVRHVGAPFLGIVADEVVALASYDDGKTLSTFTPDSAVKVPQYKTAEALYVTWEKKDD